MKRAAIIMAMGAMLAAAAWGSELLPTQINYQGRLANTNGAALTGLQHLAFRIYDAAEGGSLIWARVFPVMLTDDGTFDILLSDGGVQLGTPAEEKLEDAFQGTDRYIEIEVEGYGVLQTRQHVSAVPYAVQSQYGGWASGDFEAGRDVEVSAGGLFRDDFAVTETLTVSGETDVGTERNERGGASCSNLTANGRFTVPAGHTNEALGVIPRGGILMWSGEESTIPEGWTVCDGRAANGMTTPDLRGLFVVNPGTHAQGTTGGAERVALTLDQMPEHSHGYTLPSARGDGTMWLVDTDQDLWRRDSTQWATESTGGGQAHENRPPYYALYYIMRTR